MVYPMTQLAVIAPIVFIVLMAFFLGIGLLAGWKRGVFWGGGNLIGYIIVILIFRFAGGPITNLIVPLVTKLLKQFADLTSAEAAPLINTALAPVLFIVFFFLWELILLINYCTWYKKVTGLKRDILAKKRVKYCFENNIKLEVDPTDHRHLKYKLTQFDLDRLRNKPYNIANRLLGSVSLFALTMPTTITFAQTISSLTTTTSTRTTGFTSFVGDFTKNINNTSWLTWMSYYDGEYSDKMDAALATAKSVMTAGPSPYELRFSTTSTTELKDLPSLFVVIATYVAYNSAALSSFKIISEMNTGFDEPGKNDVEAFAKNFIQKWNDLFAYDETTKKKIVPEIDNTDVHKVLNTQMTMNIITPILTQKYAPSGGLEFDKTMVDAITADANGYIGLIYDGIANGTSITLPNVDKTGFHDPIQLEPINKLTLSKTVKDLIVDGCYKTLNKTKISEDQESLDKLKALVEKIVCLYFEFK